MAIIRLDDDWRLKGEILMENEQELQRDLQAEITPVEVEVAETEPDEEPEQNTFNQQPPPLPKKRRLGAKKVVAVILIIVLCAGAGFGGGMAAITLSGYTIQGDNITINPDDSVNTAEAIATKVLPSVVGISTSTKVTYQSWNGQEEGLQSGVGTGIIIDEDGYILTNSHVVSDGTAQTITVGLSDGRELSGKVLWNDKSIDLAIVKIEATGLTAAELGDSDEINIGAYAVAIGNPLGLDFERSVTAGVISGLNRTITVSDGQTETTMDNLIQTDAAINSGNSGGPLLNAKGQVIGINSAKAQTGEGLGFAIPINTAIPIIQSVLESGSFQRVYLGIKGGSVAEYQAAYPDQKLASEIGVIVTDFLTNSPAKAAGLEKGDIIVAIDDDAIENMTDLISTLLKYQSGDKVKVKVVRGDDTITIQVTLTTQSQ
jgi:S1-C subfamily serine protease